MRVSLSLPMLPARTTFARAALVSAVSTLAVTTVAATPAHAASASCTVVSNQVKVAVPAGSPATVTAPGGTITLNGTSCGATLAATTLISFTDELGNPDPQDVVTIDQSLGSFATTAAATEGLAFMPISAVSAPEIVVIGTSGRDDMHALPAEGGLDLDGDDDADLMWGNQRPQFLTLDGQGGDDLLVAAPQPPYESLTSIVYTLLGGPGDDVLLGGRWGDTLMGGDGADEVAGGLGDDQVGGSLGNDHLLQGGTAMQPSYTTASIPTNGAAATVSVNNNQTAAVSRVRVRVQVTHPHPEDLEITVSPPWSYAVPDPVVLTSGASGTGANLYGTVFDEAAASTLTGTGPYTGSFHPESGSLLPPDGLSPLGEWQVSVRDTSLTPSAGTVDKVDLVMVGSTFDATTGADTLDGGDGSDDLDYRTLGTGAMFQKTNGAGFYRATQGGYQSYYVNVEDVTGTYGNDYFTGFPTAAETFHGGPGDESITLNGGADVVDCGTGTGDEISLYGSADGATVDLGAGTASTPTWGTATVSGCEDVVGTPYDDVIVGDDQANTVTTWDGADTVSGGDGADDLTGGAGSDNLSGGAGNDVLRFTDDADADVFAGGADVDAVDLATSSVGGATVTLDGVADDGIVAEPVKDDVHTDVEVVRGTYGDDTLIGSAAPNALIGGGGDDSIDGRGGANSLYGGEVFDFQPWTSWGMSSAGSASGNDTVAYTGSTTGAIISLPAGTADHEGASDALWSFRDVVGSPYADTITGNGADNVITPGAGDDVVHGGDGADTFRASSAADGTDVWDSGNDAGDTVDYAARTAGVQLSKDGIANDGEAGEGDDIGTAPQDVLLGGAGADTLVGGSAADTLHGNGGNDAINGRGGNDTLYGDLGDDSVNGGSGNDDVQGAAGNDTLVGADGDDTLLGGDGNDTLIGSNGDDDEYGGLGNDRFVEGDTAGSNGSDLLRGDLGNDTVSYNGRTGAVTASLNGTFDDGAAYEQDNVSTDVENLEGTAYSDRLTGSAVANRLSGLGGNDVLSGLLGNDVLDGGTGNDTFLASSTADGADSVVGGAGTDTFDYRARTAAVVVTLDGLANDGATSEADNLRTDVEIVYGGAGADRLTGSGLANRLYGGNGNDVLTGGLGADYLDGGAGNDWFYAKDGVKDTLVGGTGTDTLKSYDSTDVRSSFP